MLKVEFNQKIWEQYVSIYSRLPWVGRAVGPQLITFAWPIAGASRAIRIELDIPFYILYLKIQPENTWVTFVQGAAKTMIA